GGLFGVEPGQGLFAVAGRDHDEAFALKVVGDALGEGRLVLDHQDPRRLTQAHALSGEVGCEASVNSRNSPVSRNATCSPMSTAWSPTRSSCRATTFMRMPHSRAWGSEARAAT